MRTTCMRLALMLLLVPVLARAAKPDTPAQPPVFPPSIGKPGTPVDRYRELNIPKPGMTSLQPLPIPVQRQLATMPDTSRPVDPRLLEYTLPEIPGLLQGYKGVVGLRLWVDRTGRVSRSAVVQSRPEADAAALRIARNIQFTPLEWRGRPVPFSTIIPIQFGAH